MITKASLRELFCALSGSIFLPQDLRQEKKLCKELRVEFVIFLHICIFIRVSLLNCELWTPKSKEKQNSNATKEARDGSSSFLHQVSVPDGWGWIWIRLTVWTDFQVRVVKRWFCPAEDRGFWRKRRKGRVCILHTKKNCFWSSELREQRKWRELRVSLRKSHGLAKAGFFTTPIKIRPLHSL